MILNSKPLFKSISMVLCFFALFLLNSCKKDSEETKSETTKADYSKFFEGTENLSAPLQRVVNEVKKQQGLDKNYIPNIINRYGYPKWDKYCSNFEKENRYRSNNAEDSVVYIPIVQNVDTTVNTSLQANISNSITLTIRQSSEYSNYTFSSGVNNIGLADEYALIYFNLTNNVYNKKHFKVIDNRLFKNIVSNTSNNFTRVVSIGVDSSQNNLFRAALECGTVSEFTVTDNCPHIGICQYTCDGCSDCIQVSNNWGNFCNTNSGGGGGVYTNPGNPGPIGSGAPPTGWTPLSPLELLTMRLNTAIAAYPQLNTSYVFSNNIDVNDAFQWGSNPSTFMYYLNNTLCAPNTFQFDNTGGQTPNPPADTPVLMCKVNRSLAGGEKILLKITRDPSDFNRYKLLEATSSEYGVTFGWSWEQQRYGVTYGTVPNGNQVIIVDIFGDEKYNVYFDAIGTVFKIPLHFRIKIDRNTGVIFSSEKI